MKIQIEDDDDGDDDNNKLAKLRRHASGVHFALIHFGKIHFGKIHFGKINFWLYTLRKYTPIAKVQKCKSGWEVVWSGVEFHFHLGQPEIGNPKV